MSKVQRTPVPFPGSQKKSKPPSIPSGPPLSSELVNSSDDSAVEDAPLPKSSAKAAKQKKEKFNIAVHRPKVNGVPKKIVVPVPSQKTAPKVVVNQQKDSETSSSQDRNDGASDDAATKQVTSSTESENKSTESESEISSDSSDEEDVSAAVQSRANERPTKPSSSHTVEFQPAQPYVPPKGFTVIPTPLNTASIPVVLLENIEGKELWHITAPAGVPLAQLKEMPLDGALNGEVVLNHNGTDYGFSGAEKGDEGTRQVLIPRQNGYKAVPGRISRTLHLQQVLQLPNLSSKQADPTTGSEAAASITRSTIRAPRAQVKGLKMRYFHSGFGDEEPGTLGSSDSDAEAPAPAGLGVMNGAQPRHKPEKKRKHAEVNGVDTSPAPKKHKKHRTPEEIKKREEKKAKKAKKERKLEKERNLS